MFKHTNESDNKFNKKVLKKRYIVKKTITIYLMHIGWQYEDLTLYYTSNLDTHICK